MESHPVASFRNRRLPHISCLACARLLIRPSSHLFRETLEELCGLKCLLPKIVKGLQCRPLAHFRDVSFGNRNNKRRCGKSRELPKVRGTARQDYVPEYFAEVLNQLVAKILLLWT